ncbi:MAG: hypothetical protein OXU68_03695 [Bacteroidota bacterium]|nr:hypothetical protein [Bacteroidota bacterium]
MPPNALLADSSPVHGVDLTSGQLPIINNMRRSEYVGATVAIALRTSAGALGRMGF